MKDLGNVSVTCENVKETTASKRRVLKAWWTQLEHVVHRGDADAGIASCRRLFHNKVPLATWNNQGMFLSACMQMLGAMYSMTCSYMEDKNCFYVGRTPGLAYLDPIKNACRANYLDRLNILIDGGYDLNKTDGNGSNALHWAAEFGCRLDFLRRILENIADVNVFNKYEMTALMEAVAWNRLDMVVLLMNHPNIDLNVQGWSNYTALHFAVDGNHPAILTQLLSDDRVDSGISDTDNQTPLSLAIRYQFAECEQRLRAHGAPLYGSYQRAFEASDEHTEQSVNGLLNMGRDPNEVDEHGRNVLHHAAWNGYSLPLFNRILEKIKDVNAVIDKDWRSALMLATSFGNLELVTALMNHPQIDLNVVGLLKRTALHFAVLATVRNTDTAILELLCSDERIDYTFESDHGNTPLGLTKAYGRNLEKCAQILRAHGAPFYGSYQRAFEQNDEETEGSVVTLLDIGVDPNKVNVDGDNALHMAASKGCRPPLCQRLVASIHDVNAANEYGFTALMVAACTNHTDVVTVLMNHRGVDLNVGRHGVTALHFAVLNNNPAIVSQLLCDDKIDATRKDYDNKTALQRAIDRKYAECEQLLRAHGAPFYGTYERAFLENDEHTEESVYALLKMGRDPNIVYENGWNALHLAAWRGCSVPLFKEILEKIKDVNAATGLECGVGVAYEATGIDFIDCPVLFLAIRNNHPDLIKTLMGHPKIDVNVQDNDGDTALHVAVWMNNPAILELLLSDKRTDCSVVDGDGRTPWQSEFCCTRDDYECGRVLEDHGAPFYGSYKRAYEENDYDHTETSVDALLKMGVDTNKVDENGRNALHWACMTIIFISNVRIPGIIRRIIETIKDVNATDKHGYTALIYAVKIGHNEAIEALLCNPRVDLNLQSADGYTALMYAVHYGHNKAAKELICNPRVDLNIQGADRYTALHIAVYTNNIDIVKELCKKSVNCKLEDLTHRTPIQVAMQKRRPECEEIMRSVSEKALGESD